MYFLRDFWPVVLIVALILVLLALFAVGFEKNRKVFEEACSKTGGATVYDGRQYQCMKR